MYVDGVDNTRINMKLHTFYGLVQCAEIKCSHYSRFCFCIEIQSVVHSNTQNPNPTPKAYCILDLQLQLACLLLPLCLFISTSNTHTHSQNYYISLHSSKRSQQRCKTDRRPTSRILINFV